MCESKMDGEKRVRSVLSVTEAQRRGQWRERGGGIETASVEGEQRNGERGGGAQ